MTTPISVPKMSEIVLRHLRSEILDGELPPGANLPTEGQLVERFGVSRSTIREAIRVLETEGFVATKRGIRGGAQIMAPTGSVAARQVGMLLRQRGATVGDVYTARLAIEPFAARLLATARDDDATSRLRELLAVERAGIDDEVDWGRAAGEFHLAVIELCGNVTIGVLGQQLHEVVESQISTEMSHEHQARRKAQLRKVDATHERLIELAEAGKAAEAESLWREHLEAARPWHVLTETVSVDELLK